MMQLITAHYSYWKDKKSFLRDVDLSNSWLLLAVEKGSFRYCIENREGIAEPNDMVICPARHTFHRKIEAPLTFHYFIFNYRKPEDPREQIMSELLHDSFRFKFTSTEKDRLYNNFRHLHQLSMHDNQESKYWCNHLLNDIWFLLFLEMSNFSNDTEQVIEDSLMKEAKRILEENANKEIHLKAVAKKLKLHPVQFTRRFRSTYGINPSQYLMNIRIEKAKSLLIHSDYTIDHIARTCGYNNGFYFSRIFSNHMKMNPSEYRRIHAMPSP